MTHPCVVTIDRRSAPRVLFSGDRLIEADLPVGSRVIYPKPPLAGLKDPDAAIRYALNHPYNSEPLHAKLRPGMKVVIAIDDISLPLPPISRGDAETRRRLSSPAEQAKRSEGKGIQVATWARRQRSARAIPSIPKHVWHLGPLPLPSFGLCASKGRPGMTGSALRGSATPRAELLSQTSES